MSSTPRFANVDTKKPDGFYVQFERVILCDDSGDNPDSNDEGFWPSLDPQAAGYVGENPATSFDDQLQAAHDRMAAFERGDWGYVGVRARALCLVVQNGHGTHINLDSAGLWGIESDAGEYLDEVYAEQVDDLKTIIAAMANPIYEVVS